VLQGDSTGSRPCSGGGASPGPQGWSPLTLQVVAGERLLPGLLNLWICRWGGREHYSMSWHCLTPLPQATQSCCQ
jgi:hypothetical protein